MRADILPGARFPDYELPDHTGTPHRLSELQGQDPMVLVLSRGSYCPKDQVQHRELVAFYPKVAVAYTQLVTISTDDLPTTRAFRESLGAEWTFLSDPGRIVQKELEIQEYTDPQHDPMVPHTLVLEPGLIVYRVYVGYWFWGRPSNDELWRDLREVSRRCRPDFDPAVPAVREAWAARQGA
jgi:peroxiredoxin